ncbi:MAG: 3-dehydroquinate synthase [Oscillospiraceae bacterium]|nr:3-dehydroquinate synthase [Oscillospiraceae bacterium]
MQTQILTTGTGESYPITVRHDLLNSIGETLTERIAPCRVMLVSDENVAPLYADRTAKSLEAAGFFVSRFVTPAGEESKSVRVFGKLLEAMCEAHLTRSDLAVALGGGVIGDLTGFAAGCYLRGIRFVQLPTTLLAAVDASVGGKTAVNLEHGKNLAGLFHQPIGVYCDIDTMRTLGDMQLRNGAAEAIKTGILGDPDLFDIFENGNYEANLEEVITRSIAYKAKIVAEDPTEKSVRKLLNFGHTPAHAIELLSDFAIPHGYAVAIGMSMMTRAAKSHQIVDSETCSRIIRTIARSGLDTKCPYSAKEMAKIALLDKKASGRDITVILPEAIGRCRMEKIPLSELETLLAEGLEEQA